MTRWQSPVTSRITDDNGADLLLHQRGSAPVYELRVTRLRRHTSVDLDSTKMRQLAYGLLGAADLLDADLVGSNCPVRGGPLGRCPCVDPKPPSGLPASNMQTVVA